MKKIIKRDAHIIVQTKALRIKLRYFSNLLILLLTFILIFEPAAELPNELPKQAQFQYCPANFQLQILKIHPSKMKKNYKFCK